MLLPVPSLHAPPTQTGSGSKCQTLPSARFTRSMMKQCGGTLVRSRRPFTRPPAHVSMGTGTCCCLSRLCRCRGPEPGQAASARPCLWCALHRSMTKQCGGTLVRSRRPVTGPPVHLSMGTGTCCCLFLSLHAPRTQNGSGSKCQTRPVVRASSLDDETVRRHAGVSTRTGRKGCPCCSPASCPGQASGDRNPGVTMPASPAPRLAGP